MISIITPSYNSMPYILKTYQSILNQTYENWEWVVTDDCSSDGTFEALLDLSVKDSRVKVFSNQENSGAAVSRNRSISESTGDFLAFIDSDDEWLPNKLETQIKFMESNNINFSFTAYELIDKDGRKLGQSVDTVASNTISYEDMLRKKSTIGCSTVMLRRSAFDDLAMPLLRTGQDYALWLKLLKTGHAAYSITQILTNYRILPDSISRNKFKKSLRQWMIYREVEKLSFTKSLECFIFYAWRAVFRR
ncbi:putative teichuronic acid biosynthesis glycosyltransferase TuaG [Vibrio chagasii]|nr:putative teichuronic acid biosynthesis glycosyltransferase TuaG [Vibrio chagasii]CAH6806966.1 putative teichuronic acid biosynthesis glycosyltransferase TuaG [Vibrio chagasii]CAH6903828.1 putative teichuronic acid biosynthesis glycosyltransferase TuaG [Vibrio chagasii]CAH6905650.1 putative teichuronic acid biosynthesis glycosyltransferase TuaG [Vibrio chagasii]CAH6911875.1 putative teichuronic acid biosynthesis glycosyltransferase TuaG [Vibrio chagasii]